jgi:YegS/Rv2252/BmrU family lipid kinase
MAAERSIDVVINAESGVGDKQEISDQLREIFSAAAINARIALARSGNEVVELARRAVQSESKIIVAGGGDGTVNAVVSVLRGKDKMLGILPLGTFNHFAKDLHIPLDLEGAAQTIIAGNTMPVDLGEVNGRIFLNNSSLGLYPSIVRERKRQQRLGYGKWPAFVWAAFTVLRRYPFLDVRLNADGKEFNSRTPFVFIGNNEYQMESFYIGARPCLDAGRLSLYITNRTSRLGLIRLALRALFGELRKEKDFIAMCSEEIWIETRHRHLRVATDGEVALMHPPLHYRVRPLALRVLAPKRNQSSE